MIRHPQPLWHRTGLGTRTDANFRWRVRTDHPGHRGQRLRRWKADPLAPTAAGSSAKPEPWQEQERDVLVPGEIGTEPIHGATPGRE